MNGELLSAPEEDFAARHHVESPVALEVYHHERGRGLRLLADVRASKETSPPRLRAPDPRLRIVPYALAIRGEEVLLLVGADGLVRVVTIRRVETLLLEFTEKTG